MCRKFDPLSTHSLLSMFPRLSSVSALCLKTKMDGVSVAILAQGMSVAVAPIEIATLQFEDGFSRFHAVPRDGSH